MIQLNQLKTIPIKTQTDWDTLKKESKYLTDWGRNNLSAGLFDYAKSVVIEPYYTCKDHRNLYSNFYSKKFVESSRYTERLHFFNINSVDVTSIAFMPEDLNKHYLGYSIIRPVNERCIGRSVFDPQKITKLNPDEYFTLSCQFKAHINGQNFTVQGYPYTSQDTDVTVCAHSALWGVSRYLSEKYSLYKEQYPFDLVNFTESHSGRTFPYRGMTYTDYCNILSEFGTYPLVIKLKNSRIDPKIDHDEFCNLYSYIESGFPVLASFQGHVVSIIGHTIDYNIPLNTSHSEFIDSSLFLKQLVIVDDNFFPYQLLGYSNDKNNYGVKYSPEYTIDSIVTAVCPLPEKVFLPAEKARKIALKYFDAYKTQIPITGKSPWVTRLYITTSTSFKNRKLKNIIETKTVDKISYFTSQLNMPHFIWVMEISPINSYKNKKCTGEIVIDPTAGMFDESVIYMRIGDSLILDGSEKKVDNSLMEYKQYTHNLGER